MALVRVRPDVACGVIHPVTLAPTSLRAGAEFDSSDPIVRAFPWAFDVGGVESATSRPGEKRSTRRPARTSPGDAT